MFEAQKVFNNYLSVLISRGVTTGKLKHYFSLVNLFKNLKDYQIVDKRLDDKTYGKLVIAVKNEWNSIKDSI